MRALNGSGISFAAHDTHSGHIIKSKFKNQNEDTRKQLEYFNTVWYNGQACLIMLTF